MNGLKDEHIPVLAAILAGQISLPQDGVMVDATIGHGGHSFLFGKQLGPKGVILGLDVDEKTIQRAQLTLKDLKCRVILKKSNFADIDMQMRQYGIEKADFILADLGFCSAQLEDEEKGLSFMQNMPLDMRLDKSLSTTAADIVNNSDEKSLADLIYKYGEDRASRRIARFIVESRQNEPIETTGQLSNIVCKALARPGRRWTKIHPATRTFQALRIAVNNELENLKILLDKSEDLLAVGGKIAIISFHSLEDRIVKYNFRQNADRNIYKILTKKPIVADRQECLSNPRARSAKLRIAQKINKYETTD
ncbi:MAG: 16S rRNA (cytosine(1402)-N(4))-methyltransferase RsmH [Sedimentisphaerales bacterium]|nr:16S rRNA (cytosine(1402)-N(4))-methyltransferase RsmH [Sedimentisphaerales bacterium]